MRHQVKKIKFKKGQDATQSIARKLIINFIKNNKIETTVKKAKVLKTLLDRLVYQAKKNTQSAKNILLSYLPDKKVREKFVKIAQEEFKDQISGFVRLIKTGYRLNDGSEMAKVEWVKPVLEIKQKKEEKKESKNKNL